MHRVKNVNFRTIVTSHIDVVPPHIPYSISGNTIYGRGSNDAKGSVATQIQAVEELRQSGKIADGDIGLLYVVGEEVVHV
jgi:acetylornithine deacetylase